MLQFLCFYVSFKLKTKNRLGVLLSGRLHVKHMQGPGFNPSIRKINKYYKFKKNSFIPCVHAYNPSTWEAEAGGLQIQV
jgi:hypothetical protein